MGNLQEPSQRTGLGSVSKIPAVKLLRRKWKGRSSTVASVKELRREKTRQKTVVYMPRACGGRKSKREPSRLTGRERWTRN